MHYIIGQYPPSKTGAVTSCDAASEEEAVKEFSERFDVRFVKKDVNGYDGLTDGTRDFLLFEGDEGVRRFTGMLVSFGIIEYIE